MANDLVLELKEINKSYPGVKALDNVNFNLRKGEIHALVGENGAGKSTLIKILAGAIPPDNGSILYKDKEIKDLNPRKALILGIQTIYQEHTLFPLLTVLENLFAGNEYLNGNIFIANTKMRKKGEAILKFLKSNISLNSIVENLGAGEQKVVEIARGLIQDSELLILDEPTTSFSQNEIANFFDVIKTLRDGGKSIIYISHRLEEIFEIADSVTIIRDGRIITSYDSIANLSEEQLISDILGKKLSVFIKRTEFEEEQVKEQISSEDIIFEAENINGNGLENVSIYLRKGELLGIAGMVGSGRTELAELLFGVKKAQRGTIKIKGKKVNMSSPKVAIENKMCFITEDRQKNGLFLIHSVLNNAVVVKRELAKSMIIFPRNEAKTTKEYVSKLNIITPSIDQETVFLSGGNQQKVVLAKWFLSNGEIFIFDEPTKGIDIGAKQEIYRLMTEILNAGKSIIMISSEMKELIVMSDRINIMRNKKIVAELHRKDISEENILTYAIGSEKNA
jgi:ribose transport system ATP-binding protein